jgi:hypothetical protein
MSSNSAIFHIANFYAKLRQSVGEGAFFPLHPRQTAYMHPLAAPWGLPNRKAAFLF